MNILKYQIPIRYSVGTAEARKTDRPTHRVCLKQDGDLMEQVLTARAYIDKKLEDLSCLPKI